MADFNRIFAGLLRLGPGSKSDTLTALSLIPETFGNLLEIGCGRGVATRLLAAQTQAHIVAMDNEPEYLESLKDLDPRVDLYCASMRALPFTNNAFDVIWSEGSAYIMGFNHALASWKRHLTNDGYLVISELVWTSDNPGAQAQAFWKNAYPGMLSIEQNKALIKRAGYRLLSTFTLSIDAWRGYLDLLKASMNRLQGSLAHSRAWQDLHREITLHSAHLNDYGYPFFIMQKRR